MKLNLKKILAVFLCLTALSALFNVAAYADTAEEDAADAPLPWSVSEDGTVLNDGESDFQLFDSPYFFVIYNEEEFIHYHTVSLPFSTQLYLKVRSTDKNAEIVWISESGGYYIYTRGDGTETLNSLLADPQIYRLAEDNSNALFDTSCVKALEQDYLSGKNARVEKVAALKPYEMITLVALDESDTYGFVQGAIFLIDGDYYYLHYPALDNTHFDANGNLSFRFGEVTLIRVSDDIVPAVEDSLVSMTKQTAEKTYETDPDDTFEPDDSTVLALFWIGFVFIGFLLPLGLLLPGLILPRKKGQAPRKHWYLLAILGGAYLFIAFLILVILLL